ncbi:MAG: OmpA family protein [Runella sp.]
MIRFQHFYLAMLFAIKTMAQVPVKEPLIQQAQRYFDTQSYAKSVALYEEILADTISYPKEQRQRALLQSAFAYSQLGDSQKAEQYYQRIIADYGEQLMTSQHYLTFAKVLANNGKMQESQRWYERSQNVQLTERQQSQRAETLTKRKISYRLDYLSINTPNAEFSPMYFRNGLVYVSGKAPSLVSSETTQKGFLDLYYVSSPDQIPSVSLSEDDKKMGASNPPRPISSNSGRILGSDAYTRITSNDSPTAGTFNSYGLNDPTAGGSGEAPKPGKPIPFSKTLNTRFHEGPATFTADGSHIIFTRNNFNEGKKGKSEDNDIKLKLYTAQWGRDDWTNVKELPFNSDDYSTAHPSLSKDGSLLYFVSDMPKGFGGKDIYVSRKENGQWGKPVNLGKELNTKQDELFPFIDERGNLYFSTAGRKGGLGGLDLYYAVLSKDGTKVIEVLHLDAPINSKGDDFGIVTDGDRTTGYFSSNRREGDDDIYRFTRESSLYECRELLLKVFESATLSAVENATISIRNRVGGEEIQTPLQTDANGWAHLCLSSDNDFVFTISKEGFIDHTVGFSTRYLTDDKPSRLEVGLEKPIIQVVVAPVETEKRNIETEKPEEDKQPLRNSRVSGVVRTETDRRPIEGVRVRLRNECTKKVLETITGPDGRYNFEITEGCDYTLIYSKDTYGTSTIKLPKMPKKSAPKVVSKDVGLLKEGDVVQLDNIYYDQGNSDLRPASKRHLDEIVSTMKRYPSLRAEILSHTDSRGDANFNLTLSQKRAQAVVDYLVQQGVAKNRLKATGMGETMPVNGCVDGVICTESEYQRNRRTEFKILEIR